MLMSQDLFLACLATILLLCAVVLLIPSVVFFIECVAAIFGQPADVAESDFREHPKLAVLVPAHNEASCIRATLETLIPQLQVSDRLIVVADNCNDDTAAIASTFDVTVIERHDLDHRGKGYALDYGLKFIETDEIEPPEVVVVVDADCAVEPGTLHRIARLADDLGHPVQATYLMEQPENPGPNDLISMFAIKIKNQVRLTGLSRLNWPCLLTGSGMAFPWSVVRKVSLAGDKTTDDMQLAIDLAIAGYPPIYCSKAKVLGRLMKDGAAKSQRARWEHGHLEMILTQVPRLLKEFVRQGRYNLLAMAIDLIVPPLSLLVILWAVVLALASLAIALGGSLIPLILVAIAGFLLSLSIFGTWAKFGRSDLPLVKLLTVALYILWKIPLYLRFLIQPQNRWVRTERDAVDTPEL